MNRCQKFTSRCLFGFLLAFFGAIPLSPVALCASRSDKPPISLDEFFSYVEIHGLALAPDGSMAVIGTERADWKRNRFRDDLWIWRANDNSLAPLTTTGHDSDPHFSRTGTISRFSLIVP